MKTAAEVLGTAIQHTQSQQQIQQQPRSLATAEERERTGRYTPDRTQEILRAYQERSSLRGLRRTCGVARKTLAHWLKQQAKTLPDLTDTLAPARTDDGLELDELWSFVSSKDNQRRVRIALCRRTRQVSGVFLAQGLKMG